MRHTYSIQVVDPAETLVVVTIGRTGNSVQLSWGTTPGKTYRVLYKDHLGQTTWKTLGNDLPATGSSLSVTDTPSGQRIYQISQLD